MKRRPATARTRAVEALRQVLEKGRNAAPVAGELARGLPAADQGLTRELVLGVLRWKDALDDEIAGVCRVPMSKLAPNLREILEVALYQLRHLDRVPQYAAVSQAVEHARASGGEGAAKLVNGVLRNILLVPPPGPESPPPPSGEEARIGRRVDAVRIARHYSHPEFLVERWLSRFGPETTRRILAADNVSPSIDLLTNSRRTTRDALRAALTSEGIATEPSPLAPLALTVTSGNPLRSGLLAAGHFSVQDVGSQVLPLLLPDGDRLVDLGAAPGGKSLSALAHRRAARVVAADGSLGRLRLVAENVRRLGVAEIHAVAAEFSALPFPQGRFDRVLLDAPCSGTGTLRKNPEIRYRVSPAAIERLARAQEGWLLHAARLLAPGGYLLYSTCSLEEEENERVVARVLEQALELVAQAIDAPPQLRPFANGARFRLFPDDRTDGFTAHLLRRSGLP